MNCKHCGEAHDELDQLACFQSQVRSWKDETLRLRKAIEDARSQLAATGCPLCLYIDGKVTKSCALHSEVDKLNLQNRELQDKLALVEKMNADNAKMRGEYLKEKHVGERLNSELQKVVDAAIYWQDSRDDWSRRAGGDARLLGTLDAYTKKPVQPWTDEQNKALEKVADSILPKRLKIKEPWIVIDVDEDEIKGWFTNINGSFRVMAQIELFAKNHAKATGHSVVIARGMIFH